MNTSYSWIKAYVPDLDCTYQEYLDAMTMSGTKVETFDALDKNLEKIVVGKILKIEKHPDADKLVVCQVDIGTHTIQIVTGAANVKEGQKVPVVLDGGKVAGGHDGGPLPENGIKIKAGKLRGVESEGMMCAIEELGSSKEMYPDAPDEGIYIMNDDAVVGSDAVEALGLHDCVFEYEITSNRVDCYSVIGIAREAAATFGKKFVYPEYKSENDANDNDNVNNYVSVDVHDMELCPRYTARVCKNIKIGPSPEWMQRRLASSGIRPINNLVDITNYVMQEFGQPMHAYDFEKINGHKIIVKRAENGDKYTTLDGTERELDSDMLMICDDSGYIGIGGIMGGENSMITDAVQTVVFEAATFNGANIRKSAKRLGLRTDASGIFEKGLDPNNAIEAINRACSLVEELGCGEIVKGVVDIHEELPKKREIKFDHTRINDLLGTEISKEDMLNIFKPLELEYDEKSEIIACPTFRQDLESIADLAEEVCRFYGYDNVSETLPVGEATTGKQTFKQRIERFARGMAEFCGFSQGLCYSFESPKVFDKLLLDKDDKLREAITIANPLGEDFSVMRTLSVNGILTGLATNYNRRNKNVRLYELGNIYLPKQIPLTELPDERMQLTYGAYGNYDFYDMKGACEEFLRHIGMRNKINYLPAGTEFGHIRVNSIAFKESYPYLHPGRQANIIYNNMCIGYLGEVHPEVLDNYDIKTRAYIAVVDIPSILDFAGFERHYTPLAKFPSINRDISMVVPKTILAGDIETTIRKKGGRLLETCGLFDVYEGDQIKDGFKSLAYSITFRDKEKTLVDAEVNEAMDKIISALEGMGIELRK